MKPIRHLVERWLRSRYGLHGLFALLLVLPLAQSLAAAHELSHLSDTAASAKIGDTLASCDLCLASAAIGGKLACGAAHLPLPVALPFAQPGLLLEAQRHAVAPRFYASRAPPLLVV